MVSINGIEIAWRDGGAANEFIDRDQTAPLLVSGSNVLAIHAVNASADDATVYSKASFPAI